MHRFEVNQNTLSTDQTATTESAKTVQIMAAETTESEAAPSVSERNPNFERGGLWMSSFHGDRYLQEDIYKVTDHVKVGFDDIFAEPIALKTGDIGQVLSPSVRRGFSLVFIYTQAAIYYFLTIVTGLFLGVAWGAVFGAVNFLVVWFVHPLLKLLFILLRVVAMPAKAFVRAFLDPLFQAIGQIFSFISAKFRLRVFGMEDKGRRGFANGRANSYPQEWLGFV